jgi:hypothetical protein
MADEFTGGARLILGADQHFVVEAPSLSLFQTPR